MTVLPRLSPFVAPEAPRLAPEKFRDPQVTARGERRARVPLERLDTLWFNTGTLCNLTCLNCYIESSPRNDALIYLTAAEVAAYLDEIALLGLGTREIGFTGGEPFMNRDFPVMLDDTLERGFEALVLTNAMRPMRRHERALLRSRARHGDRLTIRVSLDHHTAAVHEAERGVATFAKTADGLQWLARHGFSLAVAARRLVEEPEPEARAAYARLFERLGLPVDAFDPARLVLFPEMDARARRAGDHRGLLGNPGQEPVLGHVQQLAHGGAA
jgi:sulfatase maturation enzyme AslB (radical SAM superfamily)